MVEKLVAVVIDSGGCSRWCSVEAGNRLPVLCGDKRQVTGARVASWLVLAGSVAWCTAGTEPSRMIVALEVLLGEG